MEVVMRGLMTRTTMNFIKVGNADMLIITKQAKGSRERNANPE